MTEFARVPQLYVRPTIKTMMPGDIYFPVHNDVLFYDPKSLDVILYGSMELAESDIRPRKLMGRVGIMRVHGMSSNGTVIDGYVADMRHVEDMLTPTVYGDQPPENPEDEDTWREEQRDRIRVLGLVSCDIDGNQEYSGSEDARPYAASLVEHTNKMHRSTRSTLLDRVKRRRRTNARSRTPSTRATSKS